MKSFTLLLLAGTGILSVACNSEEPASPSKLDFLKEYKTTTLPIIMKGCFGESRWLPLLSDTAESHSEDGTIPYCTFKTNGNYYAVIRLGIADCSLPILRTYDAQGNLIDEKTIAIGYCGDGPGFTCEEFAIIKSDLSIYTADTMSMVNLDSLGEEIEGTLQRSVMYKKGRLLSTGKIELSDTISEILK